MFQMQTQQLLSRIEELERRVDLKPTPPAFAVLGEEYRKAGRFDEAGELVSVREDVGRHNAVDKVVGQAFLDAELPMGRTILAVSGRSSFEIMQKALAAGIPLVVAVGAPSSLAVDLARRFNMSLLGFTRSDGFNVYAGAERIAT